MSAPHAAAWAVCQWLRASAVCTARSVYLFKMLDGFNSDSANQGVPDFCTDDTDQAAHSATNRNKRGIASVRRLILISALHRNLQSAQCRAVPIG